MDVALLTISLVAAIAAVIAAVPVISGWVARPRLLLRTRGRTVSNPRPGMEGWRLVSFQLELHNAGRGWARGWRVKIRAPEHPAGKIGLPQGLPNTSGRSQHAMSDGRWIVEWWAVEEGEAVPPGQDHPLPTPCEAEVPRAGLVGDYLIVAEGFGELEGVIRVDPEGKVEMLEGGAHHDEGL